MNVLFVAIGVFLIVLGGWNIDFAHGAWERWTPKAYEAGRRGEPLPPMENVGIPWFNRTVFVRAAFWWNAGFFGGVVGGTFVLLLGIML